MAMIRRYIPKNINDVLLMIFNSFLIKTCETRKDVTSSVHNIG